ncbi:xylan 1,4-beta-xylosidase [Salibacterium salarium]|uniref:Xylan 1,4-beta-xylosidase n=1 Tax=Salibacterium salarium TaxID=284579 RepID=A0A3R9PCB8_9BACI|nr:family 43 glycosylhydrolase [Salibacterium salarium]RSL35339.1 xylan 1,4-beta-xylosidase [Salibacterium salarium]
MAIKRNGDLRDGTFLNPVLRGNYADPSIVRVKDNYYMVNTSYEYVPGLIVWQSRDLVNWMPIGTALESLNGNVWAPELVFHKGVYYIYFPADGTNWVVSANDPKGPWSKPIDLQTNYIDPGHVVGPDNKRYLHLSGGHMVQLSDDGLSVIGEVRHVYQAWRYPEDWEVEAFSPEGPKLYYHNNYYYMILAIGGTAGPPTSHMVVSSRSETPWGPWEHSPYNPIIHTESKEEYWWSQGHGTLIDTPSGEYWMVYHAYEKNLHTLGRHTMLLPIEWTDDGWLKVQTGIHAGQTIKKPEGLAVSHGFPVKDDFSTDTLGLHWQWLGEPQRKRFYQNNGALNVVEGNNENASPLLYMPGNPCYEAEVEVSIEGKAEGQFMLYYNKTAFFGISVSKEGIQHFRSFKKYKQVPYKGDKVRLLLKNYYNIVSFYYQDKDRQWIKYDKVIDASGFHHNTFGGFLSLRIGLDVTGEGKALFRKFYYRAL